MWSRVLMPQWDRVNAQAAESYSSVVSTQLLLLQTSHISDCDLSAVQK